MNASLVRVWRWVRWPLAILIVACITLVAWRVQVLNEQDKTAGAVAAIHTNKLTYDEVFADLPPEPNKEANDATFAGIDTNSNGIRDDVERAIYFNHKDSARVSAAMMQYAKALQMEFTRVYNSETLVAVIQEESRASLCVSNRDIKNEIVKFVFNTPARIAFRENIREQFLTSYTLPTDGCDLDVSSFPN